MDNRFPALTSRPLAPPDWAERALREAQHLREALSCVPFYAKRAQAHKEETGDETGYWLELYGIGSTRAGRQTPLLQPQRRRTTRRPPARPN